MERGSGILMHISSLPSPYGIGTLGKEAYDFIDFLEKSGQKYWQILPLSPTGYGDSPYQSYSTFAGNPYFIDLDMLSEWGNLDPDSYKFLNWGDNPAHIDYGKLFENKFKVLYDAYLKDIDSIKDGLDDFRIKEGYWVENYALFMALKYRYDLKPYWEWPEDIRNRNKNALNDVKNNISVDIEFWIYVQYVFDIQWKKLKDYAKSKGIKIIGDIPIYVAEDSADAWGNAEVLMLDENHRPLCVAGCPPDYFSEKGQLWGNPIYDWEYLKSTNYDWWFSRIKRLSEMCDIIRIDHFRAFSAYYSIPFGDEDAVNGKWLKGPGGDFFDCLKEHMGEDLPIIAEDLGLIDDEVRALLKYTGFPGMKVLQFAFDSGNKNAYLPFSYDKNCIAYIGTHDNETLVGWLKNISGETQNYANKYMRLNNDEGLEMGVIKTLMSSCADVAILTMQDVLGLDNFARMNVPAAGEGNWCWRMTENINDIQDKANMLKDLAEIYGR